MSFCTPYIFYFYYYFIVFVIFLVFFLKKIKTSSTAKCSWGAKDMVRRWCAAHKGTVFMTARSAVCVLVCAQAYVIFLLAVRVWACNCNRTH